MDQMPFNRSSNMQNFRTVALLAALTIAGPAWAHHPFDSEFDTNAPVKLSGKVTKIYWSDPHVVVQLGVVDAGGQTREWNFEAASPSAMEKKGWQKDTLKEGQQITIQGYRAKSEPFAAAARSITLPDGKSMSSVDDDDGGPKN
jgi:Family of unknown function (DUF6152)